jgi:hypothetical protein
LFIDDTLHVLRKIMQILFPEVERRKELEYKDGWIWNG